MSIRLFVINIREERLEDLRSRHFAALEQPEPLVEDIRAFFRPLRHEQEHR